jgi:hypothetical protein
VTWLVGLSVFTASTTVTSTGSQLVMEYHGHSVRLALQFLLTQGLAAAMLAVVIVSAGGRIDGRLRRATYVAGLAAVTVSAVQCALGVWMAGVVVPARHAHRTRVVFEAIDRLDGVKMTLLAVTFCCLAAAMGSRRWATVRAGRQPRRLIGALFGVTAAALFASAVGYLTLNDTWAAAAFVSLPLLLASVATSAVLSHREVRAIHVQSPTNA